MKVRFKCQTEYQRSYRSRSVSPQGSAQFAGLRSVHMGVSREPCLQRRKKFNSHQPPSSGSLSKTLNEPVIDAHPSKAPAALSVEPEGPPGQQCTEQKTEKNTDAATPETSDHFTMKSKQLNYSPAHLDLQEPTANNHALRRKAGLKSTRQKSGLHKTEYNRQFVMKSAPPSLSPTMAAHQRKNKNASKNKPRQKSESLDPDINRQLSSSKEVVPDRPLSHLKANRVLTEYESRFRCPLSQIPEEIDVSTNQAPQIKKLREQALLYRRRAWGTNFCRDHLSQLLSEHNALWEPTETIESMTERPQSTRLDLCQISSAGPGSECSLEALDLASNSSRSSYRASAVNSNNEEIKQMNKTTQTNTAMPQSTHSPLADEILLLEEQDNYNEEDEGRLPTPVLKMMPIQRTHLDLTTPAKVIIRFLTQIVVVWGAMLVGKLKGTDEFIQRSGTANSNALASVHTPEKPREAWAADTTQHKPDSKPMTSRNNDRLSVMSWRSAASCTMASAVLERAQKRRDNFWGKC
ncbi:hypothetical protein WMY93_022111 [Mugilogobius chulae]|uniref:Nuclear protein MDM1 n=1 Tax=Mugilogobius chulae TaxID=88201 RepID=A0AAW0NPZ1_9GOBI